MVGWIIKVHVGLGRGTSGRQSLILGEMGFLGGRDLGPGWGSWGCFCINSIAWAMNRSAGDLIALCVVVIAC